jgi:hypothetical protein
MKKQVAEFNYDEIVICFEELRIVMDQNQIDRQLPEKHCMLK